MTCTLRGAKIFSIHLLRCFKEENRVNAIEQLWYGNLDPSQSFGRGNKEMRELEKLILLNQEKLGKDLNEKSRDLLDRLLACTNEYVCLNCQQAFYDGYCMGAKMTADTLYGADHVIMA